MGSHRPKAKGWAWLRANKTLFTKTGGGCVCGALVLSRA